MKTELTGIERTGRVVLALITGLLIWVTAIDEKSFSVEYSIPLHVTVPERYVVLSVSTDTVTLRYNGSGGDMLSFQLGNGPAALTREFVPANGSSLPLDSGLDLSATALQPAGPVELSHLLPGAVSISIDTVISRSVPVAPVFDDGIPARFRFYEINPEFVTVEGPASIVNLIDSLRTDSVFPGTEPVPASLASRVDMVAYSDDSVRVSVFTPSMPVRTGLFSPGSSLTP